MNPNNSCLDCGHVWRPRKSALSVRCPSCRSINVTAYESALDETPLEPSSLGKVSWIIRWPVLVVGWTTLLLFTLVAYGGAFGAWGYSIFWLATSVWGGLLWAALVFFSAYPSFSRCQESRQRLCALQRASLLPWRREIDMAPSPPTTPHGRLGPTVRRHMTRLFTRVRSQSGGVRWAWIAKKPIAQSLLT